MNKKEFQELTGEDPEDMFGAEWENAIEEVLQCTHICSGNCRREGCNCVCGEYHIDLTKN